MCTITAKKIKITNFKGIPFFEVYLNRETNIYGDNGTGKSTISDAWHWLFYGKNSEDVAQFEIKPLDANNRFIKDQETEVEAILDVDGVEIAVRKVLRQKWVKRRGEIDANYNGDENIYYWNDVPLKETEFKVKVKAIIDDGLFRLITNPFYFNSLKWQERRNLLFQIAGHISDQEIVAGLGVDITANTHYGALLAALNQNKSIDEYKREITAKKKKIKDEAESIPSRIDEVKRSLPQQQDYASMKLQLKDLTAELESVQGLINDEVAQEAEAQKRKATALKDHNDKVNAHQRKLFDLQNRIKAIDLSVNETAKEQGNKLTAEIQTLTRRRSVKMDELSGYKSDLERLRHNADRLGDELQKLRDLVDETDERQLPAFDENEFLCPACLRELPLDKIEERKTAIVENFNRKKVEEIEELQKKGLSKKQEQDAIHTRLQTLGAIVQKLNSEIEALSHEISAKECELSNVAGSFHETAAALLDQHAEYKQLMTELQQVQQTTFTEPVFERRAASDELSIRRRSLNERIAALQKQLADEALADRQTARVKELKGQETKLAQELAYLEGAEFAILQFTKAKVETIERRINGMFSLVKFKLFNTQVNGGEVECCDTLINGVPFSDANNAAKINAGVDIINTFCCHYNVYAPIFIDNRESVIKLIHSNSQIVNLIVSEYDKQLRVA